MATKSDAKTVLILGGMVTSTIHVLINLPAMFYVMKVRAWRKGTLRASGMALQA